MVKSILKPTIPLSPLKTIPPRIAPSTESLKRNDGQKSPEKFPRRSPNPSNAKSPEHGSVNTLSPSSSRARVALRTEEQQQAAAKEKERQEVLAHKDARRKSLGKLTQRPGL